MIPDRATLQTGLGGVPEAVLECLRNHRRLGIHTGMFSDGPQPLIERGAEDNAHKTPHPRKAVASFALGTSALYRHIHDNPFFEFRPCRHTNDPEVIARNGRMAAVNSALEVILSGQVRQDSVAGVRFSGAGGQADSIRGAARARHGVPVIALPAMARGGAASRIVPRLKAGAGVVTWRADVRWIVTEFGAVNLHGLNLRQRAEAPTGIAHPDFRAELEREASRLFVR